MDDEEVRDELEDDMPIKKNPLLDDDADDTDEVETPEADGDPEEESDDYL